MEINNITKISGQIRTGAHEQELIKEKWVLGHLMVKDVYSKYYSHREDLKQSTIYLKVEYHTAFGPLCEKVLP